MPKLNLRYVRTHTEYVEEFVYFFLELVTHFNNSSFKTI